MNIFDDIDRPAGEVVLTIGLCLLDLPAFMVPLRSSPKYGARSSWHRSSRTILRANGSLE